MAADQKAAEPIVWEEHSVSLAPGKDAVIPVLLSVNTEAVNVRQE